MVVPGENEIVRKLFFSPPGMPCHYLLFAESMFERH